MYLFTMLYCLSEKILLNKKNEILITGGCGFVGTNLSLYLNSKGFMCIV